MACASAAFRAAAKSSTQTKSNTRAPNSRAISRVRSTLPVSTTTISSKIPRTDSRQLRQVLLLVPDDHGQADPGTARPDRSPAAGPRRSDSFSESLRSGIFDPLPSQLRRPTGSSSTRRPAGTSGPHLAANRRAFSSSSRSASIPLPDERPAAEVVDEQVMRHGQLEPGPPRPLGQVVVVEEPQSEPLIEPADRRRTRPAS